MPTEEEAETEVDLPVGSVGRGKTETLSVLARGAQGGKSVIGAVGNALAILEGVLRDVPASGAKSAA